MNIVDFFKKAYCWFSPIFYSSYLKTKNLKILLTLIVVVEKSKPRVAVPFFCLKMSASFEVNQGDFLFVIKH